MASFDENGKYIKTNWKAGDKITATKLNKIEESIEAVNDNDISRHVEADARLDALEAKDVAHDKELTNIKNTIANNKAAAELGDYDINSRMTFLENELNEGIEEVHNVAETVDGKINAAVSNVNNVASTVDGKIATAEANMAAQVNTAKNEMTTQVNQGKADMEAMVAEVEADLEGLHAKVNYITPQMFGAKGDGVTDDTDAIQNMFKTNANKIVFESGKTYLIKSPIRVNKDNTHIDFNNATIFWNGVESLNNNNAQNRYYGAFTFEGNELQGDMEIKELSRDCTNENQISGYSFTVNEHGLVKGDYIRVCIDMGEWDKQYLDYKPVLDRVCRVLSVDGDKIFTDLNTPFEFDLDNAKTKVLKKLDLLENIVVENLNYRDLTPDNFDFGSIDERASWVGALSFHRCRNIVCKNIKSYHHKFPSIMLRSCYKGTLMDISAYDKSSSGGGLGYIIQVMQSVYINVENCYGENISPVVDFSTSAFCSVRNAGSRAGLITNNSNTKNKFTCHGQCEHDILFDNCHGHIHFGNGIREFTVLTENIKIINCSGCFGCEHVHNLMVSNSDIKLGIYEGFPGRIYGTNVSFDNCNIEIGAYNYTIKMLDRGKYNNKFLKFNNCNINVTGIRTNGTRFIIRNFANVMIDTCTFAKTFKNMGSNIDYRLYMFIDNYLTSISNSSFVNLGLEYSYDTTNELDEPQNHTTRIKCIGNTFKRTIDTDQFGMLGALKFMETFTEKDNNWFIDIQNCIFDAYNITQQIRSVYFTENDKPTDTYLVFRNNYCNNANDWVVDRLSNCTLIQNGNVYINCSGGLPNRETNTQN